MYKKNWLWWNAWIRIRFTVVMSMLRPAWIRILLNTWIIIIWILLVWVLSFHTPWNIFLRKPWLGSLYSTMVIWIKLVVLRPMSTSVMNITIKTQWSTNITWIMGERRDVLIPISNSPIIINILSEIVKGILNDILRPTYMSCIIIPTISYFNSVILNNTSWSPGLWEEEWLVWYLYPTLPLPPTDYSVFKD